MPRSKATFRTVVLTGVLTIAVAQATAAEKLSDILKWEVDDQGDAVLGIVFTSGEGAPSGLSIRHHMENKDTVHATIELPEPVKYNLIRANK